jgi:phage anti-repressor protein
MSAKQTMDIVRLIQSNPISNLTNASNSLLIEKINEKFTSEQQQLFIASFYCYLNYHSTNDYVIDMDDIWKWLGFSRKDPCKRMLEKHFTKNVDYKISTEVSHPNVGNSEKDELKGGRPKEIILLNIDTFKSLCMLAGTGKSKEIRSYFIKLEDIMNAVVSTEANELKNQLQIQKTENEQINKALLREREKSMMHRHNMLLQQYGNVPNIVYIILVKFLEAFDNTVINNLNDCRKVKFIIKIGESRKGLNWRYEEHKGKYSECIILDCFPVKRSHDFESFLHKKLAAYRCKTLEGHENERELFLVGGELTNATVENLVKQNIKDFNNDDMLIAQLQSDLETSNARIEQLTSQIENANNINEARLLEKFDKIVEEKIDDMKIVLLEEMRKINVKSQLKLTNNFGERYHALGQKVQQINPETMTVVKVFESVADVSKTLKVPRNSLEKAIREKTVYQNFRWIHLDETTTDSCSIEPTRSKKFEQDTGYVAKLNKTKDKILAVYLDGQKASIENGYKSCAYLDHYIKNTKLVDGVYYVRYKSCDENLKKDFLQRTGNKEIVLYKTNGIGVYDLEKKLIKEFKSKHDCISNTDIGNKSITRALNTGESYNNYYYKNLHNKIVIKI